MSDQDRFQEITKSVGQKLWSIMPPEADEIYFQASLYDNYAQRGAHWRKKDGSLGYFEWGEAPGDIDERIEADLRVMKTLDIFCEQPWDHVTVTLNEKGKINFHYAYVPEEDDWPNLLMKGVSDLTDAEIFANRVPKDIWAEKVKLAIPRKEREATSLEERGLSDAAVKKRAEAKALAQRLSAYNTGNE